MKTRKYIAYTLLIAVLSMQLILFTSCGKNEVTATKPVPDIYAEIDAKVELPELLALNPTDLTDYLGITPALYAEYTAHIPIEAVLGDMLLIFKAKDAESLATLEAKIGNFRTQKLNEMNNYLPAQYEKINASQIVKRGLFVWLVVSDNSADILSIIDGNIK